MRFTRQQRFHKGDDFNPPPKLGCKYEFGGFICRIFSVSPSQRSQPRLGIIASRRVGNAVKRNRGKRVFREIFRNCHAHIPEHCDVIIIVRAKFDQYSFQQLRGHFLQACKRYASRTL